MAERGEPVAHGGSEAPEGGTLVAGRGLPDHRGAAPGAGYERGRSGDPPLCGELATTAETDRHGMHIPNL